VKVMCPAISGQLNLTIPDFSAC